MMQSILHGYNEQLNNWVSRCRSKVVITASGGLRGPKGIELKKIADNACQLAAKEGFKVTLSYFAGNCKETN